MGEADRHDVKKVASGRDSLNTIVCGSGTAMLAIELANPHPALRGGLPHPLDRVLDVLGGQLAPVVELDPERTLNV